MVLSSNAICAKAKTMYGNRIKQVDYMELSRKQSISEVINYLKSQTMYNIVLTDIDGHNIHRHQLEAILEKEHFNQCTKLFRYASKKEMNFYLKEIIKIEIKLITDKIINIDESQANNFSLEIPDYLARYLSFDPYQLININTYKELIEYLSKTKYYQILVNFDFNNPIDFNNLNRQLEELYYDHYIEDIKKLYKGKTQKALLTMLYTSIELKNIIKIYRLKKYFKESNQSIESRLLLKYSRLPKVVMEQLISAKNVNAFMTILSSSLYQLNFDDEEYVYIEYHTQKIRYNLAKRYMRFSNEAPLVYMTYSILQGIEVDNLKHIIEGIRYGKDATSIDELLIYV